MSDIRTKKMQLPEAMKMIQKLQARIAELEIFRYAEDEHRNAMGGSEPNRDYGQKPTNPYLTLRPKPPAPPRLVKKIRHAIKAEGIREMLEEEVHYDTDLGWVVLVRDIKEYADKLEKGDGERGV